MAEPELHLLRKRIQGESVIQLLLESTSDASCVLTENLAIVDANPAFLALCERHQVEEILGRSPGEALGCQVSRGLQAACSDNGSTCLLCDADRALARGDRFGHVPVRERCCLTRTGADRCSLEIEATLCRVSLDAGRMLVLLLRDLTTEPVHEALDRTFMHDVMNTVSAISGHAALLARLDLPPVLRTEHQRRLQRAVLRLTNEIDFHRRLQEGEDSPACPQTVRVAELLAELQESLSQHEAAASHELTVTAAGELTVQTDPGLLLRVLGNLVLNALEAAPHGSRVDLSARPEPEGVVIHVHNGSVIPPELARKLMVEEVSTKAPTGRGLGLLSARLITERFLGGSVTFTSAPGDGTEFQVHLPANPSAHGIAPGAAG